MIVCGGPGSADNAESFGTVQARLGEVLACNRPGSGLGHVLVALPSYSIGESLLSHYADRIPAMEHRYLLALFALSEIESCEIVFISSLEPGAEVLDYYTSLVPAARRRGVRERWRVLTVPDPTPRSLAAKLLDRPDLLGALRASFAGRPAFIEPWNVTEHEVEVARRLGAPINGTSPALRHLGHKSTGRRLFAQAGVPLPVGCEDVRTVNDVVTAIDAIRSARPGAAAVVIKHDDSGSGVGNVVIDLCGTDAAPGGDELRARISALPQWYLDDLRGGGVVEELVAGQRFASPSVQVDMAPSGEVTVLATHDQILNSAGGQEYTGCRFPADTAYAVEIAGHARAAGAELARRGCVGRASIDFAAVCDHGGRWTVTALEINLRKGGTTHPYAALRNLVPGRYDPGLGSWVARDGTTRAYVSTDNVVDDAWLGVPPATVIKAVAAAGMQFDHRAGTGVVLHMLSCLAIDGRFGVTAIGRTPDHAADLYEQAVAAVVRRVHGRMDHGADRWATRTSKPPGPSVRRGWSEVWSGRPAPTRLAAREADLRHGACRPRRCRRAAGTRRSRRARVRCPSRCPPRRWPIPPAGGPAGNRGRHRPPPRGHPGRGSPPTGQWRSAARLGRPVPGAPAAAVR